MIDGYQICPVCDMEFMRTKHHFKYCSDKCAQIDKERQREKHKKICPVCGTEFISDKYHKKYCSDECRITVRNERQRKYYYEHLEERRAYHREYNRIYYRTVTKASMIEPDGRKKIKVEPVKPKTAKECQQMYNDCYDCPFSDCIQGRDY